MKVCAAQFRPIAGDFETNRTKHLELIELAVIQRADVLFFPEPESVKPAPTLSLSPPASTF